MTTQPTVGAMRAARKIVLNSLLTTQPPSSTFSTARDETLIFAIAHIIDRETGLAKLIEVVACYLYTFHGEAHHELAAHVTPKTIASLARDALAEHDTGETTDD